MSNEELFSLFLPVQKEMHDLMIGSFGLRFKGTQKFDDIERRIMEMGI